MRKTSILLLAVVIILIVLLIGRFDFSEADFSAQNPAWNGITQFIGNYSVKYLHSISDLSGSAENNTILVVGPTVNFTHEEAEQSELFMQQGGTLVVMDDFGTANSLLLNISSPIVIDEVPLCDMTFFYKRQSFPIILYIDQKGVTSGVGNLSLNHPAILNVTENATVLARSSPASWKDKNGDLGFDGTEPFGQYPVLAMAQYGKGQLIVASDPDIIANAMIGQEANAIFASNIAKTGTLYLDISHSEKLPPLVAVFYMVRYDLVAQLLCVLLLAVIAYAVYQRVKIKRLILGPELKQSAPVDRKQSIIDFIKAKLPAKEHEIKELNRKL